MNLRPLQSEKHLAGSFRYKAKGSVEKIIEQKNYPGYIDIDFKNKSEAKEIYKELHKKTFYKAGRQFSTGGWYDQHKKKPDRAQKIITN